jgi:LPXTG-motif cell wall-anchored protein
MPNVEFKIYGEYGVGGGESITYTDNKGVEHTVYLVDSVTTGADGTATLPGMRLSSGGRSFLYVVDEVATPDGYVKLSEPIVRSVDIDSQNYQDGVYTLVIENVQKELISELKAQVSVTATKEWALPSDILPEDYPDITLHLYRRTGTQKAVYLGKVILDGNDRSGTTDQGVKYTITGGWTVTWSELPYAADGSDTRYEYFVAEDHITGYNTYYSTYLQTLTLNTGQVQAAQAKDSLETQLKRQITVTNVTGYELPSTGGLGTQWHTIFGFALILASGWLYWRGRYKKKRGGGDSS